MKEQNLFFGGTIITMDNLNTIAEAVLVEDGIIKAVGSFDKLRKKNKDATLIDLHGNVMMPGFIEPHAHFDLCAMTDQMKTVSGYILKDTDAVIDAIKEAVEETPKGKWVMCFGLDFLLNRDLPDIDRYWLDEISPENPIAIIIQSMHTIYVNSLGLKAAGIDRNTQNTRDGHCYKDENGEPLGIMTEQGFIVPIVGLWLKDLDKPPIEILLEELPVWVKNGITSTWVAGYSPLFPNHVQLMCDFFNSPKCPIRADYSITFNSMDDGTVDLSSSKLQNTARTKMTGIKSWYDGSPYTGNMLMYDNYLDNDIMQKKLYVPANQAGERLFPRDVFYEILKKYHNMGYQLSIHAQGDKAGHEVLTMLNRLLAEFPRKDHRHRLKHCAFLSKDDLDLVKNNEITLSFHTNHLYYYGEALQELVIGKERTENLLPCGSALRNGIRISFHSDAPMYTVGPLRVACNAVTRTSRKGTVIGKDEAISVLEALRGITIDAAWQMFRENEIGSIEPNKFADFTILAENPFEVDPAHIGDIEIVTTYISGVDTHTLGY